MNDRVLFDVSDLRHLPDSLDDGIGETTGVTLEVTVVYLADTDGSISEKRVLLVSDLEKVEVVVHDGVVEIVLQHNNVRVVEDLVLVLSLEGMEGGERERRPLTGDVMGSR